MVGNLFFTEGILAAMTWMGALARAATDVRVQGAPGLQPAACTISLVLLCCMGFCEFCQIFLEGDGLPAQDARQARLSSLQPGHQRRVLAALPHDLPQRFQMCNGCVIKVRPLLPDLSLPS